jgi:hypothetical protein
MKKQDKTKIRVLIFSDSCSFDLLFYNEKKCTAFLKAIKKALKNEKSLIQISNI